MQLNFHYLKMHCLFILAILAKLSANKAPGRGDLRVYKGRDDTHNEFPFIVLLEKKNSGIRACTGSLIAEDWVLTVAHCIERDELLVIRYGDFTKPAKETTLYSSVIKKYLHPSYRPYRYFERRFPLNDIGLIFTEEIPNKNLARLLALDYKAFLGLPVKNAGFGLVTKHYDKIEVTSKEVREWHLIPFQIGEGIVVDCEPDFYSCFICVAPKCSNRKQQIRPGDSGGPLVYDGRVIGVTCKFSHNTSISHFIYPCKPIFRMDSKNHALE
ncbi:mast cell protease 2-like [Cydia fagiglandana]|uniref:mast cell protease 2-like n=1 Tax=Cydia fagiglandana TaxID=1458189 RepID=UPI002FEE5358